MILVQFPEPDFRITSRDGNDYIFDAVRKNWIRLTPEEWVRQNMIAFLNRVLHIPLSLIAVEKQLKVGELSRRFDIVVFRQSVPWLLIECKSMDVPLGDATISQMLSYVSALQCPYFFITNGRATYGWQVQQSQFAVLESFPSYT